MINNRSRLALAAFGVSAALAVAAVPLIARAQPAESCQLRANPPPGAANRSPSAQDQPPARGGQFNRRLRGYEGREARLECRLDFIRNELHITPAQQSLWDNFANTVREEAEQTRNRDLNRGPGPYARPDRGPDEFGNNRPYGPPSVVERLERRQQNLADRGARVDHVLATLRPLYASLNNEQRLAADQLMFRREQSREARWGFPMRGRFQRPIERPYGPFDPPFDRFDRYR